MNVIPPGREIHGVIAGSANVRPSKVSGEKNLIADLGMDSVDFVTLCADLEYFYGIEISDDAWNSVTTVNQVVELVQKLAAANA